MENVPVEKDLDREGKHIVKRQHKRRKPRNWTIRSMIRFPSQLPRWQTWIFRLVLILFLYSILKVLATGEHFIGVWLSVFLSTIEAIFLYVSKTILSPIGLILIALLWLVKAGDLYQLMNKLRYMRLAKGELPAVQVTSESETKAARDRSSPLNAWERTLLGEIERTSHIEEQRDKLSQLIIYEQLLAKPFALPLLQFLHHYRRDDIRFFQVAQFLAGEGLLHKEQLSRQELDIEATVLGYLSYLQHEGLIEAHFTLQPTPDGFYGTIHKVKIPQRVQEVMQLFQE